jgi:hypothetical protein
VGADKAYQDFMSSLKKNLIPLLALLYLVACAFFIWGVAASHYKIFPSKQMIAAYEELRDFFAVDPGSNKSALDKIMLDAQEVPSDYDFIGFQVRDPEFVDKGYLLISRYAKDRNEPVIELFSIADEKVLHTWLMPFEEILAKAPNYRAEKYAANNEIKARVPTSVERVRPLHPLMDDDGGLYVKPEQGPLVRLDACGRLEWVIDRQFHHSIEFDHSGNIVVPIVIENDEDTLIKNYRDDGFAVLTRNGQILEEYSVTDILLENGFRGLLFGVGRVLVDRVHLNDAQPILENIGSARVGDIALSSRHLSSVALYRPSTNKIIWLKTGPWLNQHDINLLPDGSFSIFGNDVYDPKNGWPRPIQKDRSASYIFNPLNGDISQPYEDIMRKEKILSTLEGRLRILPNKDAFLEQANTGRLIRVSDDTVRWEYVNNATDDTAAFLNWSRYFNADEINLEWLENLSCNE